MNISSDKSMQQTLKLITVSDSEEHIVALYALLKNREFGISHKCLPSFREHIEFVKNHPYRLLMLVEFKGEYVGSIYLHTDNSIGVNILKERYSIVTLVLEEILIAYQPLPPIKSVRSEFFHINVPSDDGDLANEVAKVSGVEIQKTYLFKS